MVRGTFDSRGRPHVSAQLLIPNLDPCNLMFLLDTGADRTVLMPKDAKVVGVDYDQLPDPGDARGVGGVAKMSRVDATVVFRDADDCGSYGYEIPLRILIPSGNESEMSLPSLLGRDIINRWRVVYDDQSVCELSAEVLAADSVFGPSSN